MRYLIGLAMVCLIGGCATSPVKEIDKQLPELQFSKSEVYVLDTSKLIDPDAPNFIMMVMDKNGLRAATDTETPTHIMMLQEDLVKVEAMIDVKNAYQDIANSQATLINIERDKVDALKEMLQLERQSRILERNLRLGVEDILKQERKDHRLDNILNRATLIAIGLGGVAIAAL